MVCDECGERKAVIHFTEIQKNEVTTSHLCEQCDAEKGLIPSATPDDFQLSDFLAKMNEGDGTLAKMINDPGVYNSLLATADTLQAISVNLRGLSQNAENMTNWGALGAYRFAELMEAAKHNWLFKRYFEERGYMEKAPFEERERAIAESFRELQRQKRELLEWQQRLVERRVRPGIQPCASGAQRCQRDGFVIAAGVGVGDAGRLVISADQSGHFAHRVPPGAGQQPESSGEMCRVRPFRLRQGAREHAQADAFDVRVA